MSCFFTLRQLFSCLVLLSLSTLLLASDNSGQLNAATRLAVVNVAILLDGSPRAKFLGDDIKKQYLPREQALAKERDALKSLEELLDSDNGRASNDERIQKSRDFRQRKREYTRDYEAFRDQLNATRQKSLSIVRQEVMAAIDSVRKLQDIDIVIENYVSADKNADITNAVIQYLEVEYKKEQASDASLAPPKEK